MKTLKLLLAGIVVGVIVVALRDREGGLLAPARSRGLADLAGEEPVLGYDGMDQETLLDWLSAAALDRDTLRRIHAYESANRGREEVLLTLSEMAG